MKIRVQKWGNSLALRIPRAYAIERQLGVDSELEMTLTEEGILLTPIRPSAESLEEMLSRVTPENLHEEIDAGSSVGAEKW